MAYQMEFEGLNVVCMLKNNNMIIPFLNCSECKYPDLS